MPAKHSSQSLINGPPTSQLEFRHIRAFVEVVDHGTVSAAAVRLRVAQPALSRTVMQLEKHIGAELFARRARRLELTDAGKAFLPEARVLLDRAELATQHAQRASRGEIGRVTIGFTESAMYSGVVATAVRNFTAQQPGVVFDLREIGTVRQVELLLSHEIDVGFVCGRTVSMPSTLAGKMVLEDHLVAAIPEGHELARRRQLSLGELASGPVVLPATYTHLGLHKAVRDAWTNAGIEAAPIQDAAQLNTVMSLIAAGVGIGLVPSSMRGFRPTGVVFLPVKGFSFLLNTDAVWRDGEPSLIVQRFLDLVQPPGQQRN
jgi:DNA-binding transcriptional LysR family regulator